MAQMGRKLQICTNFLYLNALQNTFNSAIRSKNIFTMFYFSMRAFEISPGANTNLDHECQNNFMGLRRNTTGCTQSNR